MKLPFAATALFLVPLALSLRAPGNGVDKVRMTRTPCFGSCPAYEATLHPNGTLEYKGNLFVHHRGQWEARFEKKAYAELIQLIEMVKFETFKAHYFVGATDLPSAIVVVTRANKTQAVDEYGHGAPEGLHKVQRKIDSIIKSARNWAARGASGKSYKDNSSHRDTAT